MFRRSSKALHGGDPAMQLSLLFRTTAFIEALTGIALVLLPNTVAQLLLGEALSGAGAAVAPIAGVALFALGVMAWVGREAPGRSPALVAMLIYNGLAAIYLAIVLIDGEFVGPLLFPAVLLHAVLGLLLIQKWMSANDRKQ
jgi:hypothetical protein